MKSYLSILTLLLCIPIFVGCDTVEPGYVGVKVYKYGSARGVSSTPIVTGAVWYNPITTDIYKYPIYRQNVVWTQDSHEGSRNDDSVTFNSKEGSPLNADVAVSFRIEQDKAAVLFNEFRVPLEEVTRVYIRSEVRDALSRHASMMPVIDIFGVEKQRLLDEVLKDLNDNLGPKGFTFEMVSIVGAIRADTRVVASINSAIEASQRAVEAQNRIVQATAEAEQKIQTARGEAESILAVAKAQAEANKLVAESLSPKLIQWETTKKWDGRLPMFHGTGQLPMMMMLDPTSTTPKE